jgi:aspartate kinase
VESMNTMIVMKFGGTSVGSAERIKALGELVRARLAKRPVVVVSALSGVTDLLIKGARLALARDAESETVAEAVVKRHREVIEALFPAGPVRDRLTTHAETVLRDLRSFYTGVHHLEELTPRTLDAVSGMGERISCEIVAAALEAGGIRARALDARSIILTDDSYGRATPLMDETGTRVREQVLPLVQENVVPVLGGFIAQTRQGVTTTLGRGGSDWSAAIIGALLPAEEIQIWTDVDGIMTVDPRLVPGARILPEVSFEEAAELAYFGAKVLHPATIKPAVERGIPVFVLNSMNAAAPGTRIASRKSEEAPGEPRALAFKKGITVILVSQPRMLMAHGFTAKVFEVFARHRTSVDLIATSEVSISLTIDNVDTLPAVQADLAELGEVRVFRNMAIVSVVGRGFNRRAGLAGRIFQAVRDFNINMISFGASDVNISFVLDQADAEQAVKALHREFFEATR